MTLQYLKDVATLELDRDLCTGCGMCVSVCPHRVLEMEGTTARVICKDDCMECGACSRNCPAGAITVKSGVGCAVAIIRGLLTGGEPDCGGPGCGCSGSKGCC
ncbi:MAG: 4Fe-4S binding protein [Firmicutes bacterium]|nr:4Fe-4S binding protein [Bacillota bacterium]